MKKLNNMLALASVIGVLTMGVGQTSGAEPTPQRQSQRPGIIDQKVIRQRMMDNYKARLEVKDEAEWKLISDRIEKVMAARLEISSLVGTLGRQASIMGKKASEVISVVGIPAGPAEAKAIDNGANMTLRYEGRSYVFSGGVLKSIDDGGSGAPLSSGVAPSSSEVRSLQDAIEAKAPDNEIREKLAKVRDTRREMEVRLEQAQDDLRKLLSVRQEAAAVLAGLLK